MAKGVMIPCSLNMPLFLNLHQPGISPNPAPLGFCVGFITEAGLLQSLTIGNGFNLQPLFFPLSPEMRAEGLKVSTL